MKQYIKTAVLLLLCVSLAAALYGCGGTEAPDAKATATSGKTEIITQKPTQSASAGTDATEAPAETPKVTDVPTQAPTEKPPVATIEPGKETYAGGIADEAALQYAFQIPEGTSQHRMLNESLAIQFFATVAFDGLAISCPSYSDDIGTLVFTLYAWQGTYEDTIAPSNKPVAAAEFENYEDNALNQMTFEALPDGEYLLYLTTPDAAEQVGIWAMTNSAEKSETRLYADDMIDEGFACGPTISYVKTPKVKAGPLSDSGLE